VNPLKKLASQTALYGLSSIVGRFLNYLLVPLYTYTLPAASYGTVSEFYAYAGFFAVVLIFGLETGYFRFRVREEVGDKAAYAASLMIVITLNLCFISAIFIAKEPLSLWLRYPDHPEYVELFGAILAIDAVSALAFARLRAEDRAGRFVAIKLTEIIVAIGLNLLFLLGPQMLHGVWPELDGRLPSGDAWRISAIFIANLAATVVKWVLLLPQYLDVPWLKAGPVLFPIARYSLPMVVIGFAGIVNEMLDRVLLKYWLPYDLNINLKQLGIYGACYKLSILMTLFIQAFRYAAEPFFFSYSRQADAKKVYAKVMRYFVIFCVWIFLLVSLFLEFFQYFVGPEYREGLDVVPILLMANLFLGIYVNLSIWYKLTDRTGVGALISLLGAGLTLFLNIWWIPILGYLGSAWATLVCYASMSVLSYGLGRRFYPVPYPILRIIAYLLFGIGIYAIHRWILSCVVGEMWSGLALMASFSSVTLLVEWKSLRSKEMPPIADAT
jgi:O-antigen/teichoic acid export membrane protein